MAQCGYCERPERKPERRRRYGGNAGKELCEKGYSAWAIMNNMNQNGYSDEEIARALEKAGVKG